MSDLWQTERGRKIVRFAQERMSDIGEVNIVEDQFHKYYVSVRGVTYFPAYVGGTKTYVSIRRSNKNQAIMSTFLRLCTAKYIKVGTQKYVWDANKMSFDVVDKCHTSMV